MREFAWINTIISLEPFLPSSSAMVSLLVLNKISPAKRQDSVLWEELPAKIL